jgi:glycolate oxidase
MPDMFSEVDLETMQWVRQVFNPKGLANPGKMFPTPRSCGEAARAKVETVKKLEGAEVF